MQKESLPIILSSARRHFEQHGWSDSDIYYVFKNHVATFREGDDRFMLVGFDQRGRPVELGVERAYDVDRMVAFHFFKARDAYRRQL